MPVFQFIAENDGNPITYYAQTKNLGNFTRNIRCQWNKTYSKLHLESPQFNIYGIVGKAFGDYEVVELSMTMTDGENDEELSCKELLKFFCRTDNRCLNKNKHTFCKPTYQRQYYNKKKITAYDLVQPHIKAKYGI